MKIDQDRKRRGCDADFGGEHFAPGQGTRKGHPYHGRKEARSLMVGVPLAWQERLGDSPPCSPPPFAALLGKTYLEGQGRLLPFSCQEFGFSRSLFTLWCRVFRRHMTIR